MVAMAADDSNFNAPTEEIEGQIDIAGLEPGRHIVLVRGQDQDGNWESG